MFQEWLLLLVAFHVVKIDPSGFRLFPSCSQPQGKLFCRAEWLDIMVAVSQRVGLQREVTWFLGWGTGTLGIGSLVTTLSVRLSVALPGLGFPSGFQDPF